MRKFSESLPMLLLRAREVTMDHFRPILKEYGVTEQQWRVIRALYELGESNAQKLAKASFIHSSSLSRIISYLIAEQLIERTIQPKDQRESILKLTAKGVALHHSIGNPIEDKYSEIQQEMNQEKLSQLYDLLKELTHSELKKDK